MKIYDLIILTPESGQIKFHKNAELTLFSTYRQIT